MRCLGRHRRRLGLVVLCLWVLAAPVAEASVPYRGPGHEGTVPLGDGGIGLLLPAEAGDNRTFVGLSGFPTDTCRIVLDENGTYAGTHLDWTGEGGEARVWADAGVVDAPYRVVAHWIRDLKDACTAEVTPEGTIWHDPRGRPFRELHTNASRMFLAGEVGQTLRVAVTVTNNGTLASDVTAALPLRQEGWSVAGGSAALDVQVAPLEAREFHFDVAIPRSQKPVTNVVFVELSDRHGWEEKVTVFLDLRPARAVQPDEPSETDESSAELPEWRPVAKESPAPHFVPFLLVALVAYAARRR